MSLELKLMFAPARGYARAMRQLPPNTLGTALRRPALIALVFGSVAAMLTTDHIDPTLLLDTTLSWSFVVAIQLFGAIALIRSSSRKSVATKPAIDLCFAANGPWLLWMLAITAWAVATPPLARPMQMVFLSAIIPAIWTPFIVFAFCRTVLGDSTLAALGKTTVHQAAMWIAFAVYCGWAVQVWPRFLFWWHT